MPSEQSTKLAEAVREMVENLRSRADDGSYDEPLVREAADLLERLAREERDALQKRLDAVIAEADNYTDGAPDRDASANLAYRIIRLARGEE